MQRLPLEELPIATDNGGVQLRLHAEGGLTVGSYATVQSLPAQTATAGPVDDSLEPGPPRRLCDAEASQYACG